MELDIETIQKYADMAIEMWIAYLPKVVWALLTIFIWFKVAKFIWNMIDKMLTKRNIDPTIERFTVSLVKNLLKALVVVAAIGMVWVETSSFVAIFAAAGFAIGMALSGTLSHFASGIMILLFKPYKVWDRITAAGQTWVVKEVQIFNTILQTVDAKIIIIPNAEAIGSSVVNFSMVKKKRIDLTIWIWYGDSIDRAREVMTEVAKKNKYVLQKEDVTIGVKELGDNAVIFAFHTWAKTEDYWNAFFGLTEDVKKAFDATDGELNFPFPQRDVHMHNVK